jgi:hypothetical protein
MGVITMGCKDFEIAELRATVAQLREALALANNKYGKAIDELTALPPLPSPSLPPLPPLASPQDFRTAAEKLQSGARIGHYTHHCTFTVDYVDFFYALADLYDRQGQ